jgi:serine/threonine protein kinase
VRLLFLDSPTKNQTAWNAGPAYRSNLRWLPIGSILNVEASQQLSSVDVWSFGVLLWQLYLSGPDRHPHAARFPTDDEYFAFISQNKVVPPLDVPKGCTLTWPKDVYEIASACSRPLQELPRMIGITSVLQDVVAGDGIDHWEVDRTKLLYVERLGSGQFGTVDKMATTLFTEDHTLDFVAVKALKTTASSTNTSGYSYSVKEVAKDMGLVEETSVEMVKMEQDFLNEIDTMKELRHPNLVSLLGVCTTTKPYLMILNFSKGGSLEEWLPINGFRLLHPTCAKLVHMLHQVALAMVTLGNAAIVHRDLASRNVLIDEDLGVKVADFARCFQCLARRVGSRI